MTEKPNFMVAAQYRVLTIAEQEGTGLALEFIVIQHSGELGKLPAAFLPLHRAEALVADLQRAIDQLRRPH